MYQSWLLLAVAGIGPGASGDVTWQSDYGVARKAAAKERKPLVVVIGSGLTGYNKLAREGVLKDEARRLLTDQYVCLYLDTLTPAGGRQARAFPVGDLGIVISDRSGVFQAFRHEGDLSNRALVTYLQRYADPTRVFQATESNPTNHASYYSPPAGPAISRPANTT